MTRVERHLALGALQAAAGGLAVDVDALTPSLYHAYRYAQQRPDVLPSELAISLSFGGWERALAAATDLSAALPRP